jgi:hypothetical protein
MKIRSVVAHGLLLLSIGVMTGGCATTDTKSSAAKAPDSTSTRGGSTGQQAGGTRYLVKDFHAEHSNEPEEDPGALAQAGQPKSESEAEMARAMLFFPVFGVRVPIW